mgnify:CR=1 FL=1
MHVNFPIRAALPLLVLAANACATQGSAAFGVSSTPAPAGGSTAGVPLTGPTGALATATPPPTASSNSRLGLANDPRLGQILVDGDGRTLYLLMKDMPNTPTCYGDCAQQWPPFLAANGSPATATGIDPARLGTALRTDGTTQVTYNGWPLYYSARDAGPGDMNGQSADSAWFVVSPEGNPVQ